jgi:hypothetical protein
MFDALKMEGLSLDCTVGNGPRRRKDDDDVAMSSQRIKCLIGLFLKNQGFLASQNADLTLKKQK